MEFENKDLLEKIYQMKAENLDSIVKQKTKELKNEQLKNKENIKEEYEEKRISILIKEFYKEGFKDGVNLILNCLK